MGALALAVDVLGRGVSNYGTSVGDCPERVPAMHVPDGDPEGGGHIGSLWVYESNKNEVSKAPQMPAGPGAPINGLQREINTRMCGCWQVLKHKRA